MPFPDKSHIEIQTPNNELNTFAPENRRGCLPARNETENSLRVVRASDKNFDINTPPFTHFLGERVLLKMQGRDNELARAGHIVPDKIFCYEIKREGNVISEINIRNIDSDRLKELKSSIRWTFEKMHEKMKTTPA